MRHLILLLLSFITLVGCNTPTSTSTLPVTPSQVATMSETAPPASTSAPPTSRPTLTPTATPAFIGNLCAGTPQYSDGQVGLLEIYPGQTSSDEVMALVGEPDSRSYQSDGSIWSYDEGDIRYTIRFKHDNALWIERYVPEYLYNPQLTVQGVINQYGCPDAVFDLRESDHGSDLPTSIALIYWEFGLDFRIEKFPITLSDQVNEVNYFAPTAFPEYRDENISDRRGVISLSEVLIEK